MPGPTGHPGRDALARQQGQHPAAQARAEHDLGRVLGPGEPQQRLGAPAEAPPATELAPVVEPAPEGEVADAEAEAGPAYWSGPGSVTALAEHGPFLQTIWRGCVVAGRSTSSRGTN